MKNLKLFVAPLLGAALFVTACGSKPMDVKDFRAKVQEKFDLNAIKTYIGKNQHVTGTSFGQTVNNSHKITDVINPTVGLDIYVFTFVGGSKSSSTNPEILSPGAVDVYDNLKQGGATVNYFISGDAYTVEASQEAQGVKSSFKIVYQNFVITHSEANLSGQSQGTSLNINEILDYKYE